MKKIGILYHPLNELACGFGKELDTFLQSKGVSAWLCSAWEMEKGKSLLNGTELILSVGGDGTILRAAQVALKAQIPITGINCGNLGFMTEFRADEAKDGIASLLDGKGWLDERAMLEAELHLENQPPRTFHALNDVVVARGAIARLVSIDISIDKQPYTTYRADGVIVSTATGSTGYSLAAGGPILYPRLKNILLTPISPHLTQPGSLVMPPDTVIQMLLRTPLMATLSVDGHINLPLENGASLTVKRSSNVTRFFRLSPPAFLYGSLEQRLKGKLQR